MNANWRAQLGRIYAAPDVDDQLARYRRSLERFAALYGAGPVSVFRVPGRINLIGEHTDYQQGYVLPAALDKDILFLARRREDALVRVHNLEENAFPPREFAIAADIPPYPTGDWGNYAKGPAQLLARRAAAPLHGVDLLIAGEPPYGVPRGAGVSSSSALTVGAGLVLSELNGLGYTAAELAWLSGEAEWYVGTRGGIMDQFIAMLAQKDHALFLDCRSRGQGENGLPQFQTELVPLPQGYNLIVADTHVRHQNVRSDFNVRVAEGRIGVALLQRRYPELRYLRDLEGKDWREVEPLLPEAMTWADLDRAGIRLNELIDVRFPESAAPFRVRQRCRHIVTENQRVRQSVAALKAGDVTRFGALMNQAHASVSVDYGASCDELEIMVALARQVSGVLGARMTGAGWGGCVISLARRGCESAFIDHVRPGYHDATGIWPDIFVCQAGQGAGLVESDVVA